MNCIRFLVVASLAVFILCGCVTPEMINQTVKEMKAGRMEKRKASAQKMVEYGTYSVPYLIKTLKEGDPGVRAVSAWALGEIKDDSALPALVYAVKDTDPEVKKSVREAIMKFTPVKTEEMLGQAMVFKETEARAAVAEMLGDMREEKARTDAAQLLVKYLDDKELAVRHEVKASLKKLSPESILPLINAALSDNKAVADIAADVVGDIGKDAVDTLLDTLRNGNARTQVKAAEILGRIHDPRTLPALAEMFGKGSLPVRNACVLAVSDFGGKALPFLKKTISSQDKNVRSCVAEALGVIAQEECIGLLNILVKDPDPDVRKSAVDALGKVKNEESIKLVFEALKDKRWDVRKSAAAALAGTGWSPKDDTEKAYMLMAAQDWKGLSALGEKAVEPLKIPLSDSERWMRSSAVQSLIAIGRPAVESLTPALEDSDKELRIASAEALGKIRDEKAVQPLVKMLDDHDRDIRCTAIAALGSIGSPAALDALGLALKDQDHLVRKDVVEALGRIGGEKSAELLALALDDGDWLVRKNAVESLGTIDGKASMEGMLKALGDREGLVRRRAAEALERKGWKPQDETEKARMLVAQKKWNEVPVIGKAALEPVLSILKDRDPVERRAAALALGEIKDESSIPILKKLLVEDPFADVKMAASRSLAGFGTTAVKALVEAYDESAGQPAARKGAVEALGNIAKVNDETAEKVIDILDDESPVVRKAAADALGKIGNKKARKRLLDVLNNGDELLAVRKSAAYALGEIGVQASLDDLREAVIDVEDPGLKEEINKAIAKVKNAK